MLTNTDKPDRFSIKKIRNQIDLAGTITLPSKADITIVKKTDKETKIIIPSSIEVIDGRAYNEQSDMWSLGCLIYELCTLKPPFDASSQAELCSKIKSGKRMRKFDRIPVHYSKELWCTIQELLTQEDFLRPTSFLLLYNQTLKKNTDLKNDESEVMFDSLMESINKEATKKDSSFSEEESNSFGSLGNTVKEREKSEEEKRLEESLMKEVETMLKESQLRKEEERNERLQYKELNIDLLQSLELDNAKKSNDEECNSKFLQERIKKELSPPKCVCGGTTLEEWNKRVNLIRSNEAALRKKEMEIEARERELVKRERRVQAMEKEAKDHIQRAQIYLKQTRTKCFRPFQLKLTEKYDKCSDFDATTVSADLGYDEKPTVAYIDTQPANNPFLKMRESKLNPVSKRETYLKRSNTLDNPKSRPKQGNYYILDQSDRNISVEKMKKDEHLRSREEDFKSKLNVLTSHVTKNEQKINKSDFFCDKQKGSEKDLKVKNCTVKQLSDNKNNTRNVFHTFRHNFTKYKATGKENIVGNQKKIDKSKPNIIGRRPLQFLPHIFALALKGVFHFSCRKMLEVPSREQLGKCFVYFNCVSAYPLHLGKRVYFCHFSEHLPHNIVLNTFIYTPRRNHIIFTFPRNKLTLPPLLVVANYV
ncbi:hypothetical protein Anas_05096 [Armadillidium nasatum]|uniref:Protein kinase domain-containing protein n=1 Tax=Armadillidium nasatum TaxID=96803 RepID=A0A5N5TCD1_9CRUS|nr:hypothetical protein Anas_05096 [Armadillidium nasatum]